MPMGDTPINVHVHEENTGALVLARTFSPQLTMRMNYYAKKTIWFCEEIVNCGINILRIDIVSQLGNLFTKGLPRTTFTYLRKKIIGW